MILHDRHYLELTDDVVLRRDADGNEIKRSTLRKDSIEHQYPEVYKRFQRATRLHREWEARKKKEQKNKTEKS